MALNGTILGSVTNLSNIYSFYIKWSATQNIAENYSEIVVSTYWETKNTNYRFDTSGKRSASITINNEEPESISQRFVCNPWPSNPFLIQTVTKKISHKEDGTIDPITISARANGCANANVDGEIEMYGPSKSTSKEDDCVVPSTTITLDSITRQATITAIGVSGEFYHRFNDNQNPIIRFSNPAGNLVSSLKVCYAFIPQANPSDWNVFENGTITNLTANEFELNIDPERDLFLQKSWDRTQRSIYFALKTTINGNDYINSALAYMHIVDANPELEVDNYYYYDGNNAFCKLTEESKSSIMIKNKSKLMVDVSKLKPTLKKYAEISYYSFSLNNGTSITMYDDDSPKELKIIDSTDDLILSVAAIDSRGNTSNIITQTIDCRDYYTPYFTSFDAYRIDNNGNVNLNGEKVKWDYSVNYAPVIKTGESFQYKPTIQIHIKNYSGTITNHASGGSVNLDKDKTYTVYASISDVFGGYNESEKDTVIGAIRAFNISPDCARISIGKTLDNSKYNADGIEGVFDCRWEMRTDQPQKSLQNFSYRDIESISSDTVAEWNKQGNLATTLSTRSLNGQLNQTGFLLNISNMSTDVVSQQVHNLWLSQPNGSMFHRGGNNQGFGEWKEILDSSNYTDYIPQSTVLFNDDSGSTGTITLSQSAADFTYLEIFYMDSVFNTPQSIKVYNPNEKTIDLSSTSIAIAGVSIASKRWTISDTSLTPFTGSPHSGIVVSISTSSTVQLNTGCIKIIRVVGYKDI